MNQIKDEKVNDYLDTKGESVGADYRRAFEQLKEYTKENYGREITGSKLLEMVAVDKKREPLERKNKWVNLLKDFFEWLVEEAPKKRGSGKGLASSTAHSRISGIIDFLRHYDLPIDKKKLNLPSKTRKKVNRKVTIRAPHVRKLLEFAKTNRDKALILCGWQSGMGISELLGLDVGDVRPDQEEIRGSLKDPPLLLKLERKKTAVDYRTCFGADACEALKRYLEERERAEGELASDDPLFAQERKRNGGYSRLRPSAAAKVIKRIAVKSGLVSKERMNRADKNPAGFHALRTGFSSTWEKEDVNQVMIDGFQGHKVPFDSAYARHSDEELREFYSEHEEPLSIERKSIPKEGEIEKVVKRHVGEMGAERIMPDLKEKVDQQESKLEDLRKVIDRVSKRNEEMAEVLDRITKPEICTSCGEEMELIDEKKVQKDGAVHWERKYRCDECNRVNSDVRLNRGTNGGEGKNED